jgi:ThiF family
MSSPLISLSSDLRRLRDEGFALEVKGSYLIVHGIPYVDAARVVQLGQLVTELTLAGDLTATPATHVIYFVGDHPCDTNGNEIAQIKHASQRQPLADGLVIDHSFSNRPGAGYRDYHEKITRYVDIICAHAEAIDPSVTARTFTPIAYEATESPFQYIDTASSRADITAISRKLERGKVAIIGVGGTGSYVLDLVAKTPVSEIHLFDADVFLQHNAFRAPGAASLEDLRQKPFKVEYLKAIYERIHRGIQAHAQAIDESNIAALSDMEFVFLCLDSGEPKRRIIEQLEASGTPFVDVGMGIVVEDEALHGMVRVTTSTHEQRRHVHDHSRITFAGDENNEYTRNIQIADLNALNAALAVIRWKKLWGFYGDLDHEHHSLYVVAGNVIINEDQA